MSTAATQSTFQITTDQVSISQHPAQRGSAVTTIRTDSEQHRIDANASKPQPHRAVLLDQFTDWLQSGENQTPSVPERPVQNVPGIRTEKLVRLDSAAQTVDVCQPHFETRGYVAPAPDASVEQTIEQLKADGRIIGDLRQADNYTPTPATNRPETAILWPNITSQLVGSPAILNLEINIQRQLQRNKYRLAIASATAGSGSTTIALTMARQLAAHKNRVLLVDANLAKSTLMRELNLPSDGSWLKSVTERRSPVDLIVHDSASSVSILPMAPVRSRATWPARILDELSTVIDSIAWEYDAILIDVGATNQLITESSKPGQIADMTLLVASHDAEPYLFSLAKSKLESVGVDNMLIVQNFSRANKLAQAKVG